MSIWRKIEGIIGGVLKIGFTGPTIKKNPTQNNQLDILANDGVADGRVKVAQANIREVEVVAPDGRKTTIKMAVGASGDILFVFPNNDGNPGDFLGTDGAGNLVWSPPGGQNAETVADYELNHNSASPLNLVNMQDGTQISKIVVVVDTPFDTTGSIPTLQIGIGGTIDKYVAAADIDLQNANVYIIDVEQLEASAAQMIATYAAADAGGTQGHARIISYTSIPL